MNTMSLVQPANEVGRDKAECQKLVEKARRCLYNDCIIRLIKKMVKLGCHDGRIPGNDADGVKNFIHELWSSGLEKYDLLKVLKELGLSRFWIASALHRNVKVVERYFIRYGLQVPDIAIHVRRDIFIEEVEKAMRKQLGWNEVVMSERMWRFIGVNTEELLNYGINPHEWIEILRHITIDDAYMLGAVHGDIYARPTTYCYEVSAATTSTSGVMYFERLMRRIKMPSVEFTWKKMRSAKFTTEEEPNAIGVRFYFKIRKSEWPWYGKDYEIIGNFNARELLRYLSGLIDTDGSVTTVVESSRRYRFEIKIFSANIEFLKYLRDVIYERLGIISHVITDKRPGSASNLRFRDSQAVQLYEGLRQYLAHPMKRLKAETYVKYHNKEIPRAEYQRFHEQFRYSDDTTNDPKRYHAADMLTQAAPQTHTHGEASPVKSPRLAIKNRVKTNMKPGQKS